MTKKSDNTSPLQKLLKSGSTQKAVKEMSAVTDNSEAQEECFDHIIGSLFFFITGFIIERIFFSLFIIKTRSG